MFGGSTVLHWGMEGRLSRDIDVQQSRSSSFLIDLAPASAGLIRHRDSEGPDPKRPYVEIAPPEADSYFAPILGLRASTDRAQHCLEYAGSGGNRGIKNGFC